MAQSYKTIKREVHFAKDKKKTVYNVRPVSYGTLTTEDAAKQIAQESTASPGDVKAVLDRYAHYVVDNLRKGYSIELLGFGTLFLRFITRKSVEKEEDADASLVKGLVPGFRPHYTMMSGGSRLYDLIPEKVTLVKFDPKKKDETEDSTDTTKTDKGATIDTGGGTRADTGTDTKSDTGTDTGTDTGNEGAPA